MNFFDDLRVGERRELGSHTFTAEAIKAFATRYDPQAFHVDEEAAARSHFGRLCASGWQTGAVCMRLIVLANQREAQARRARGEDVPNVGPSPGVRDIRWHKPVYAGDTISYALEIKELRDVSWPGYGLVVSATTGTNQAGELVYSALGAVFVERRSAAPSK
jgi:acyl dehydratase